MQEIELLVLAGGFGTRLRPAVSDVPKPLAPVAGQPYLGYLIKRWLEQGVTRLTFLLHHQSWLIEKFLADQIDTGVLGNCELRTLVEPQPLGTGGAVAYAVREFGITGTFLVANADTWMDDSIAQLATAPVPAIGVVYVEDCERYGSVCVENGKVTAFREKAASAGAGYINAGLYHLDVGLFLDWDGRPFSVEKELFPQLVAQQKLGAIDLENTNFIDIGIPADYLRFCRWIESAKIAPL